MSTAETKYLHIFRNHAPYLLLKGPSHFHLIHISEAFTEAKLKKLLRVYPCTDEQLRAMGFSFTAFRRENLRGVVIQGSSTGDGLELWIGASVERYTLGTDYTKEFLSEFFSGHTVTHRPKAKWKGLQMSKIRTTIWIIHWISILASGFFYFSPHLSKFWSALCILSQIAVFTLCILYPDSFTLEGNTNQNSFLQQKRKGNLFFPMIIPGVALELRTSVEFTYLDSSFWILLGISAILGLTLWAVYMHRHKMLLDKWIRTIVVAIILSLILFHGFIAQLNYILDVNEPRSKICEVVDKSMSGSRSTTYYCTVLLPDGTTQEIRVSGSDYRALQIGERIWILYYEGALGLPFIGYEIP